VNGGGPLRGNGVEDISAIPPATASEAAHDTTHGWKRVTLEVGGKRLMEPAKYSLNMLVDAEQERVSKKMQLLEQAGVCVFDDAHPALPVEYAPRKIEPFKLLPAAVLLQQERKRTSSGELPRTGQPAAGARQSDCAPTPARSARGQPPPASEGEGGSSPHDPSDSAATHETRALAAPPLSPPAAEPGSVLQPAGEEKRELGLLKEPPRSARELVRDLSHVPPRSARHASARRSHQLATPSDPAAGDGDGTAREREHAPADESSCLVADDCSGGAQRPLRRCAGWEPFDEELVPGGAQLVVTDANKREYCRLLAARRLYGQADVAEYCDALCAGFHSLLPAPVARIFAPRELQRAICGERRLDTRLLSAAVKYGGGFQSDSPPVLWFWEVVNEFSEEQQAALMLFWTGARAAPLSFNPRDQAHWELTKRSVEAPAKADDLLPEAATCIYALRLPAYSSKVRLQRQLAVALAYGAEGYDENGH
jgi:hypothetical protein